MRSMSVHTGTLIHKLLMFLLVRRQVELLAGWLAASSSRQALCMMSTSRALAAAEVARAHLTACANHNKLSLTDRRPER